MADKLNRGSGLSPNSGLTQNSVKLGSSGLTAKDAGAAPAAGSWELIGGAGSWQLIGAGGNWELIT